MNPCENYQEMISRMLDGELSKAERDELAEHVKRCPDCAAVYVAFRSLSESITSDLEEPPERIYETVMAEVRRDALRKRNKAAAASHRRWQAVLTAAACLVLVVAAGLALPRIVGRGTRGITEEAPMAAQHAAENKSAAVSDASAGFMRAAEEAPAENSVQGNYGGYLKTEPETAFEEDSGSGEAPPALLYSEEQPLMLSEAQSEALIERMTYDKVPLEAEPDLELHLVYLEDGTPKDLTVFLVGEEALYVFADGDSFCLIEGGARALLELLGYSS